MCTPFPVHKYISGAHRTPSSVALQAVGPSRCPWASGCSARPRPGRPACSGSIIVCPWASQPAFYTLRLCPRHLSVCRLCHSLGAGVGFPAKFGDQESLFSLPRVSEAAWMFAQLRVEIYKTYTITRVTQLQSSLGWMWHALCAAAPYIFYSFTLFLLSSLLPSALSLHVCR